MTNKGQIDLLESAFRTAQPGNPLFCHQDFLEKLAEHRRDAVGKRASLLMQRMAVDTQRIHYKPTYGPNRGWRRSRLGGNQGSHFYAWWTTRSAVPIHDQDGFGQAPDGALFLRDIRHHDDHSPLNAQSFDNNYLSLTVRELRAEEYSPAPWTQNQARFANARAPVRVLKGHPGSGKTTALWHAADATGATRVLYVTYSRDLAALAREYFDRYCSDHKHFHVVTYAALIRELLGSDAPLTPEIESRQQFIRDLVPFSRILSAWTNHQVALFDELHAHLAGAALPVAVGRFPASKHGRLADRAFKDRRTRFLGPAPTAAALDVANRLERDEHGALARKYFPELALAWQCAISEPPPAMLEFDCIAVDEVQDLTPVEAYVLVKLAAAINRGRSLPIPVLLAGDEAQTVRPTDFEWGWMNDLLHAQLTTPSEYKLSANLRSPRKIAELVNRVWDLYSLIDKQDRPSGTGYAEIDDDANDQVLCCNAVPGVELNDLLTTLAAREGLALISLEDKVPAYVPDPVKPAVLSAREAKGLDFHSVCILDPGRQVQRIHHLDERFSSAAEIEDLRKRLAIDQLRVAISRPTERLIWLDINPTESIVEDSLQFLNGTIIPRNRTVTSWVPSALLKTLEEEQLDLEERIQRCQQDARQYLEIRPEMAWSRAQQAVALLGELGTPSAIEDPSVRETAYLTLAEICFTLGMRKAKIPPELGRVHMFQEAADASGKARKFGMLALVLGAIGSVIDANIADRQNALLKLAQLLGGESLPSWVLVEIAPRVNGWMEELEGALFNGQNAAVLIKLLPPAYQALGVVDGPARLERLRKRAIQLLIKDSQFREALQALQAQPERQPRLEAQCYEGLKEFASAAQSYREAGALKEALNCYRSIPDIQGALQVMTEIGDHPAAEPLRWITRMQKLVEERPANFIKTVTAAEKKQLEQMLEQSLGVTRKRPAARKTAAVKKVSVKKAAPVKKRAPKRPEFF